MSDIGQDEERLELCGIVMPISAFADYDTNHWSNVRDIIDRAISEAGFRPIPVWEHSSTDIIQGRIVRNLYELPVIVCDISGLNPNVMFELGLRLAFKKPVVLLVDEKTKIPFDTNSIDHLIYGSSLQFQETEKMIDVLAEKISAIKVAHKSGNYEAFIDTFGAFSTFEPNPQKVEIDEYVARRLDDIVSQIRRLSHENRALQNVIFQDPPGASLGAHQRNALAGYISDSEIISAPSRWTPEREAKLIQLWKEGKTATQIAQNLGGLSRNSVIGKAHRLGLSSGPRPDGSNT